MASMNGRVKAKENSHTGSWVKDQEVFCCAGIVDTRKALMDEWSILTPSDYTGLRPNSQQLHDRMPAMLSPETEKTVVDPALSKKMFDLLVPYDSDKMDAYAVSKKWAM